MNIRNTNNQSNIEKIKNNILSYFYTYRLQSDIYINLPNSQAIFDINQIIVTKTSLYMPTFVFSSYS